MRQPILEPDGEPGVMNQRTMYHRGAFADDHENAPREAAVGPELPLVSIITPCFNAASFIEQCVESALAQSYPRVEHVVQDGASADGTVAILEHYTGRIDWVSEPDRGQADALDKALKRSRGDILLVLNADDVLLPHAASWAVEVIAKYPTDAVIYGDLYLIDEEGNTTGKYVAPEYDFAGVLCVEKVLPAQAAFIRRSAFEQVGLEADVTLDTCPDYEIFVRLGLRFPMRHVRGFVAKYRACDRPMDGTKPRTVDRFVRAKAAVMERVFDDPTAPDSVKALRRRAKAGLLLWASEEARNMGDSRSAVRYFLDALSQFGVIGRTLAAAIRLHLRRQEERTRRETYRSSPSLSRALIVGSGLIKGFARAGQVEPFLRFVGAVTFWVLASLALFVLMIYLIFVIL